MSRRASSFQGNGSGVETVPAKAKAKDAPPADAISVEFTEHWASLLAALRDGIVTPWLPSAPGAGGSICGPRPDLLLSVKRGGVPAGFFFCRPKAPTMFEVVPLLTLTGAEAIEAGRQAVRKLFLEGPATSIFIACPEGVAGAVAFARGCGLQGLGTVATVGGQQGFGWWGGGSGGGKANFSYPSAKSGNWWV